MKLTLSVISFAGADFKSSKKITLNGEGASIGRQENNTFVLLDPNRYVSRCHALIEYRSPHYFIIDISANGVLINDSKAPLGKGHRIKLNDGDHLTIGDYIIEVKLEDDFFEADSQTIPPLSDGQFNFPDDPFADLNSDSDQGMKDKNDLIPIDWKNVTEKSNDPFEFPDSVIPEKINSSQGEYEHIRPYKEAFSGVPAEKKESSDIAQPPNIPPDIFPEDWFQTNNNNQKDVPQFTTTTTSNTKPQVQTETKSAKHEPLPAELKEKNALSAQENMVEDGLIARNITEKKSLKPISKSQAEVALRNAGFTRASRCSGNEPDTFGISDVVDCTVFAPPCINTQFDQSFIVQVFVHLFEQAETAKNMAKEFDEMAERRGCKSLETEIAFGSKLIFHLCMPSLEVTYPLQTLTWLGRPDAVQFAVNIPGSVMGGNKIGTVTISQDSVPIGQISFTLKLSLAKSSQQSDITGEASIYKKAFISYASSDRNEVLKRVQMLSRLRVNFFQDLLSLEPGQRWEREIYHHIDESDVFFLFWSSAAKASPWVMKEVAYALKRKNGNETIPPTIVPIIIEGPPPVSPPGELAHLHFNDYLLYLQT
ncbi:MAG: TIR domain-containing protein [Gammaproteobacteria bacterium]